MTKTKTLQERFKVSGQTPEEFFFVTANMIQSVEETEPPYSSDSRKRDKWLSNFLRTEPHLAGVVNSVTAIDKNRGWRVIGGRNQVKRITDMLHNFHCAPGLSGWRPALATASEAFWTSDIGAIVELGKESKNGPVRALYNVDPLKCRLTGKMDYPLMYYPPSGKSQKWDENDFFRVVSLPSMREEFFGLGNCALSRCVQLAKLMVALYRHEEERLLARAPRGLLMLSGIKRDQWDKAMETRDEELDSNNTKYFGAIAVLASAATSVDAKLVALSELPTNFDLKIWMDMLMYGYSLCFGYDASEFWPVQYGALGRGNEVQIQHEKATGKGRLDFVLGFQEQLGNNLPDSISMEFDQRDEQGDLVHAAVDQAWANLVNTLVNKDGLTPAEGRIILAQHDIIPSSWADTDISHSTDLLDQENEEDSPDSGSNGESPSSSDQPSETSSDSASAVSNRRPTELKLKGESHTMRLLRDSLRDKDYIRSASEKYPDDEIVQYNYPSNTIFTLWERGDDVYKRKLYERVGPQYPPGPRVAFQPPPLPPEMRNK